MALIATVVLALVVTASPLDAALPPFYAVPAPLPLGASGALMKSEDLGPVGGGERFRVMYHSRSVTGTDIAVTGLVFVPTTPAPPGGRPVLGWAHGTVGEADECAPSIGGYDPEFLSDWLARGYVVAATDYEGLGTPGLHPYLVGESEGRGVLDAVRAAQELPGSSASNRVVLFGHSQGGQAALFANELAPTYAPELQVAGTIAAAPASQLVFAFDLVDLGPVVRAAVVMMAAGFAAAYPSLDVHDILTPEAVSRLGVVDTECQQGVADAYADLTGPEIVAQQPADVPAWDAALLASEPGFRVGASPVLIVHGTADEEVPYVASQLLDQRMTSTGQPHIFLTYPGETHAGVLIAAKATILDWATEQLGAAPSEPGPGTAIDRGATTASDSTPEGDAEAVSPAYTG